MIHSLVRILVVLLFALGLVAPCFTQTGAAKTAVSEVFPVGDWRGDSICQVRPSACHDEDSLYHVTKIAGKPGQFSLQADKIVDGKPETMGTSECTYDAVKQTLECPLGRATVKFTVTDKTMDGVMLQPDKTVWRKITLKKVEAKRAS